MAQGADGSREAKPDHPGGDRPPRSDPLQAAGARGSGGRSRRKGRKIPAVTIPEELLAIGFTPELFAERVQFCKVTKKPGAWQKELDRLAPLVDEVGGSVVLEVYEDASTSGWQGCTPAFVRERANGGERRRRAPRPGAHGVVDQRGLGDLGL